MFFLFHAILLLNYHVEIISDEAGNTIIQDLVDLEYCQEDRVISKLQLPYHYFKNVNWYDFKKLYSRWEKIAPVPTSAFSLGKFYTLNKHSRLIVYANHFDVDNSIYSVHEIYSAPWSISWQTDNWYVNITINGTENGMMRF